ncbi:MAG: hypothetical protein JRI25_17740 [Deltaproteobacteria bacterium]|nr:hypothetical protein [Deltaproteobacteria bacterium]
MVLFCVIIGAGCLALLLFGAYLDVLPDKLAPAVVVKLKFAFWMVAGVTVLGLGILVLTRQVAEATGIWPKVRHRLRRDDLPEPEHPLPTIAVGWRLMAAVRLLPIPLAFYALGRLPVPSPLPVVVIGMVGLGTMLATAGLLVAPVVGAWVMVRGEIAGGGYKRADQALRLCAALLFPPETRWLSAKSMLMGSHPECAEAIYRALWRGPGGYGLRALCAEGVGWALLRRGGAKSARAAFETAVRGDPHLPHAWEGLVASMLLDGAHPEDVEAPLALGEASVRRIWYRLLHPPLESRFVALRAWTLAAGGRADDARNALAAGWIPEDHVSAAATVCWYRGHALKHLGDPSGCRAAFERGAAIDPNGSAGRSCRYAL